MSWIDKILPPRIKREEGAARKTVPEGLWTKCPGCEAVLYTAELQKPCLSARSARSTCALGTCKA